MNELLEQFLIESRELAEQATAGLLALEHAPQDAAQLDEVFRALHTLKGGAGIVDFFAMERAAHAAEDLLSAARAGKRALTPVTVGHCLACVDQILQWLDTIEQTGELPAASSDTEAERIVARFATAMEGSAPAAALPAAADEWPAALLARHPAVRPRAATAIRFVPDPNSFFEGEDPLNRLTALPGLLALEATGASPWPPLAELDPYHCNLQLLALTEAAASQAREFLHGLSGHCELVGLPSREPDTPASTLPPRALAVLTAQLQLVRETTAASSYGHLASAARTAHNVLQSCGRAADAAQLAAVRGATDVAALAALEPALMRLLGHQVIETAPLVAAAAATAASTAAPRAETTSRTLRVDASRIDALVRLTGELTVAKNALAHVAKLAATQANPLAATLKSRHAVFEQLIGQLQRSVLDLRVLPLRVVFQRFPRLLREISETLDKPVELQISGEDTEADKAIIEMLFEPLLHVLRNAVDHGVEETSLRTERGKPRVATISMQALRQGDQVVVEITDDGGGIDVGRVREIAAARGVATAEVLDAMGNAELVDLVFAPGFSTAAQVTSLSGRGVGMDAVRTAVERVGGRVSIQTRPGQGTTVRFMLPFSIMMTTVMSVAAGGQMFGIPLDAVVETVRLPRSSLAGVGAARAVVLREQTIPVFGLAQMLGEPGAAPTGEATLVIAAFAGQRCGLEVDSLGERLDIILKPLDGLLASTPGITGTTLLGDGRVLLVLDIAELLQ